MSQAQEQLRVAAVVLPSLLVLLVAAGLWGARVADITQRAAARIVGQWRSRRERIWREREGRSA